MHLSIKDYTHPDDLPVEMKALERLLAREIPAIVSKSDACARMRQ